MPYPIERVSQGSSREEILAAIQESVAQMVAEGMPEEQAIQEANRLAQERTQGTAASTKNLSTRSVGALRPGAGPDGGLGGASQVGGGYQSTRGGRYGA